MTFKEKMHGAWDSVARDPATLMAVIQLLIALGDLVVRAIKSHRESCRPRPSASEWDHDLF